VSVQRFRSPGRLVSTDGYWTARGLFGGIYKLVVFDAGGLPVMPLTVWYHLRSIPGKETTRDAYFSRLRPIFAAWQAEGLSWTDPPGQIEQHVLFYLTHHLGVLARQDYDLAGYRLELTIHSRITPAGLRQLTSAVRDFYRTMAEAKYYPYRNPMESPLLKQLRHIHAQALLKGDLPGTVDYLFRPTATFRERSRKDWDLNPLRSQAHVLVGLSDAIHHLTTLPLSSPTRKRLPKQRHHATISRRDRGILLLLRTSGARIGEVCSLTIGGFRSFSRDHSAPVSVLVPVGEGEDDTIVLYQAMLRDKGSNQRETKEIWMPQETQDALLDYLANERPLYDPNGPRVLAALADAESFFLSEQGQPYSRNAFMKHWYTLYPLVADRCPLHFTVHSIRHLFVTDVLAFARRELGQSSADYLAFKQSFGKDVMNWSTPKTIDVYDHSIERLETLGLLARYLMMGALRGQAAIRRIERTRVEQETTANEPRPITASPSDTMPAGGEDWFMRCREKYRTPMRQKDL